MANTVLTPSMIAKEALMAFKNALGFTKNINKQLSSEFAIKGAKIGQSITIRKPARFTVASGAALVNQDVVEEPTVLTLDKQKHVAFTFSSAELTLSVDEFRKRYIDNAVIALANQVDTDGLTMAYQNTFNSVGTPGTTPSALLTYLQAQQKLNESACQLDKRSFFINPAASTSIVDNLKSLFQSSEQISNQYKKGMMGIAAGGDWMMSQNIVVHTVGQQGGTPLVNGAGQSGSSLITDGWTAAVAVRLKQGDIFTIAGVNGVNPVTKQSTGQLQQFVVTADFSSSAGGAGTISISPPILDSTSGSLQTVTALPADNAALTVVGAGNTPTAQNILCHEDAFVMGAADLELPQGVDFAAVASDPESGLSMRIVRDYNISSDSFPCRLDILYGHKAVRPEWACRIQG